MSSFSPFAKTYVLPWVLVPSFQFGFAISALNQIQGVLTCKTPSGAANLDPGILNLPQCIPMSDATFSLVTSIFTLGGLFSSLCANVVMDKYGRKPAVVLNGILVASGSALMAVSSGVFPLLFGRLLIGLGAGVGLCVVPVFLSEIAPQTIKGSVGVLNQLSIVIGILVTQSLGLKLAQPGSWRFVFVVSSALSVGQLLLGAAMFESPAWLKGQRRDPEAKRVAERLWNGPRTDDSEQALLAEAPETAAEHKESVTFLQAFSEPELRRPLIIVSTAMITQQISGINAVLYYSNDILAKVLPQSAAYVSLGVTVVNALMTFPPIFLIERLGRRKILLLSTIGSLASLFILGYAINEGAVRVAGFFIVAFVACFAVGLGPIPFVIIPDVSPFHAVSALSSVALSLNWVINFIVGLSFLPLRNYLADGDPNKGGLVFYFFGATLGISSFIFFRFFR